MVGVTTRRKRVETCGRASGRRFQMQRVKTTSKLAHVQGPKRHSLPYLQPLTLRLVVEFHLHAHTHGRWKLV